MGATAVLDGALRAALVPAFSPRRWRRYLERGGEPARLRREGAGTLGSRLGIGRSEAIALARSLARADPEAELARATEAGARVLPWGGEEYPACLLELADPPPALWVSGALLECDARAVAVVGSRQATGYGLRVARALAGDLARAGVTVVAGLARGVDRAAHEGALDAEGRTLAVLGSGLLRPYPPEHADLMARIAESGAVLSEFPLLTEPARLHFPRRNRIIAALALGTVVVEAAERSGARITAQHALDLGRTVMAVPGPVGGALSCGTLRMLQEGAAPVGGAADVFCALGWCDTPPSELPEGERAVLEALGEQGASAAGVASATGLREEAAAGYLITLEVRGLVQREGGRYMPV